MTFIYLTCSVIYLYQYELMDIYFIFWIIILFYLFIALIVPALAIGIAFGWSEYPFIITT